MHGETWVPAGNKAGPVPFSAVCLSLRICSRKKKKKFCLYICLSVGGGGFTPCLGRSQVFGLRAIFFSLSLSIKEISKVQRLVVVWFGTVVFWSGSTRMSVI